MRKINRIIFVIAVCIILVCAGCNHRVSSKLLYQTDYTPTLFLHGAPSTRNAMLPMMNRLEKDVDGNHNLTLIVSEDGKVRTEGEYQRVRYPLIQVVFENNDSTLENQVLWLADCMKYLKQHYHINTVNFVGHSMGGVDILNYLLEVEPNIRNQVPRLNKVVTLGAPFNGEDLGDSEDYQTVEQYGPKDETKDYQEMKELAEVQHLNVKSWLNIAADLNGDGQGDTSVAVDSVAALSPIMRKQKINYQFEVVTGIGHSGLHESNLVDQKVQEFLWG